ncbi:MAG: bifunctional UDP-N-acetylglucosamine diphosphorylase/glucosamine-1-phosphate N-acetyltransferase GlmU [Alphaproteobacteria bacterium]
MSKQPFFPIILAAGQGSRMKSDTPKVLHPVGGQPMLYHILATLKTMGCGQVCVVTAPNMGDVRATLGNAIDHAIQETPLGTAHAVLSAESYIKENQDPILVLYGDTPLIEAETLWLMLEALEHNHLVVLGMHRTDPKSYGRIFADETGRINRIVEAKDATLEERSHTLCNSGVMLIRHEVCLPLLKKVSNHNANKEFYLTDLIELGNQAGYQSKVIIRHYDELRGVNTRQDLSEVEHVFQDRKREEFMKLGVTLVDPSTVYFSFDTKIGPDVVIEPFVTVGPGTVIEKGVTLKSFTVIEGSHIQENAVIGPFARLRPGTKVGEKAKIGNFVEIKKSTLDKGAKVSHLSYIGDATIGENTNIGAGTITCNYDGFSKHETRLGKNVFVGSNTSLVAPLVVEDNAILGAGSVVTENVSKDSLVIARAPQQNIPQGASKFRDKRKK